MKKTTIDIKTHISVVLFLGALMFIFFVAGTYQLNKEDSFSLEESCYEKCKWAEHCEIEPINKTDSSIKSYINCQYNCHYFCYNGVHN